MSNHNISLIAAVAENGVIGRDNTLPWITEYGKERYSADMLRFRSLTIGHPVIIGRNTFESILAFSKKPLQQRTNIILTNNHSYHDYDNVKIARSFDEAIDLGKRSEGSEELFIAGGTHVYNEGINRADTLYITDIFGSFEGDAFFPKKDTDIWKLTQSEPHQHFAFQTYKRR